MGECDGHDKLMILPNKCEQYINSDTKTDDNVGKRATVRVNLDKEGAIGLKKYIRTHQHCEVFAYRYSGRVRGHA